MQANVKITANGAGRGKVYVDGVDVTRGVGGVEARVSAGEAATVALTLVAPRIEDLEMSDAGVSINGVCFPLSVELALHRYLCEKHGPVVIDTTSLVNEERVYGLRSA